MPLKSIFKVSMYTFIAIFSTLTHSNGLFAQKRIPKNEMIGIASWYSNRLEKGRTASGNKFNQNEYTCATNHFKMGTWLKVTNIKKHRSVVVYVNDRMGKRSKRIIDLTKAAAIKIGLLDQGLAKVKIESLGTRKPSGAD